MKTIELADAESNIGRLIAEARQEPIQVEGYNGDSAVLLAATEGPDFALSTVRYLAAVPRRVRVMGHPVTAGGTV